MCVCRVEPEATRRGGGYLVPEQVAHAAAAEAHPGTSTGTAVPFANVTSVTGAQRGTNDEG